MTDTFPPRTVADVMTRSLITIREDETIENIEEGMKRFRFRHLPVVTKEGRLVGLVTHRDMLHASSSMFSSDRDKRDELIHKRVKVGMLMKSEVTTGSPETPLVEAGQTMWKEKLGCLPVVDDAGMLVGILTEADFVQLATKFLRQVES